MVKFLLILAAVLIAVLVSALVVTIGRLRQSQAATKRTNDELQQLAHAVSHDLPEPLRAITGFTGLLREDYSDQLDHTAGEFLGYIANSSQRMESMLAGLLEYSRIDTLGELLRRIEPTTAVEDARKQLGETIKKSSADVTVGSLPRVMGDHKQIVRLFRHLIDNAIKFAIPPNTCPPDITISATPPVRGMIEFQIHDNGIGIPENQREEAFKLFRQLHPRDAYPGAGTGLAICRRIVRRHGGQIWIAPSDHQGTTVCFTLPSA